MEKVDVYSNKREKTGKITERDNIEHGEYRLSVHVWFESKEKILIQKRTQNKSWIYFKNCFFNRTGYKLLSRYELCFIIFIPNIKW